LKDFIQSLRALIDARLRRYLDAKAIETCELAPSALELTEVVDSLTSRGGKRLRPVLLAAAYRAVQPGGDVERTLEAGAAVELLQSFLLIHDDFMDRDEERRGGPTAHVVLQRAHGGDAHRGASLAVLAGDLASTYAWELLLEAPFAARRDEALQCFIRAQKEVYLGQHLDVVGDPDTQRMQQLKTGSYTVRLPLELGALLGDASPAQLGALRSFGEPLGEAFQLRDDLLGTFGDPAVTGKPRGNDLRAGKRTALIAEAEELLSHDDRAVLDRAHGNSKATDEAIDDASRLLVARGVRNRIERRAERLVAAALDALDGAELGGEGRQLLKELAALLTARVA